MFVCVCACASKQALQFIEFTLVLLDLNGSMDNTLQVGVRLVLNTKRTVRLLWLSK